MVSGYRVQIRSLEICGEIATLRLDHPSGFDFAAGQWLRLTLETADGTVTKTFTIASAPADLWLEVTTRLSGSPFKDALAGLVVGDEVEIAGPGGPLRLPSTDKIAFLIGGVGITPVRSMLRDAVSRGRSFSDALLVYGNRDPSCVPYREELLSMGESGVRVAEIFESAPPTWDGPLGFIDAALVRLLMDPGDGRPFVVTGPPVMVAAMERVLDQLGVDESRRLIERFGPPVRPSA